MNILVTGGAGFIGSNLVIRLLEAGHSVDVLDNLSTGNFENLRNAVGFNFVQGDLRDEALVTKAVARCDYLFHLGAMGSVPKSLVYPVEYLQSNVLGTVNILEALRIRRIKGVFASSSSVYGSNPMLPKSENQFTRPLSPYAASKLSMESFISAYSSSYHLPLLTFRFFNVYGPHQLPNHPYAAVIPRWIWSAIHGNPVKVFGDGLQTRDFTFVADVVEILFQALERDIEHEGPINLAFGNSVSLLHVYQILQKFYPKLTIEREPSRSSDVLHSENDPKLLRKLFKEFNETSISDGIEKTVLWIEENEKLLKSRNETK